MRTLLLRSSLKYLPTNLIRTIGTSVKMSSVPYSHFSEPFHLFPAPKDITPTFEIYRTIANALTKLSYHYFEPEYSEAKFINGAKLAITHMAKAMRENNVEVINDIALKSFSTPLRQRMSEIPQEVLQQRLTFTKENIVHAFIHSLVVAPNKAFDLDPSGYCFFGKVIAVIDPNSTKTLSLSKAIDNASVDTIFCNVTVCRHLNPPDLWKISHINFFEKRFV